MDVAGRERTRCVRRAQALTTSAVTEPSTPRTGRKKARQRTLFPPGESAGCMRRTEDEMISIPHRPDLGRFSHDTRGMTADQAPTPREARTHRAQRQAGYEPACGLEKDEGSRRERVGGGPGPRAARRRPFHVGNAQECLGHPYRDREYRKRAGTGRHLASRHMSGTGLRLQRTARTRLVGGHSVDSRLHRHRVQADRHGRRQSDDQSHQHAKDSPEHAGEVLPVHARFKRNPPEGPLVAAHGPTVAPAACTNCSANRSG